MTATLDSTCFNGVTGNMRVDEAVARVLERERALGLKDGWQEEHLPHILPANWAFAARGVDGIAATRIDGLCAILSVAIASDNHPWAHLSLSYRSRLPTWQELREAKDIFITPFRKAIQVLPEASEYVNMHPYCLHLWARLDGDPLPDFTEGSGSI